MASTGTMSDFLAHMCLNASLNDGLFAEPAGTFLALGTATITAGLNASAITEPTATWTNYARQAITPAQWDAAAVRAKDTNADTDFGTAVTTADTNCTDWAIVSTVSGAGDILWYGKLDGTIIVQNTNPVKVPLGTLKVAVSTALGTPP